MARNNLTISLPLEQIQRLESLAHDGESAGQAAKRLLLQTLGETTIAPSPDLLERLDKLETAIAAINARLDEGCGDFSSMGDRLETLEQSQGHLDPDDLARLTKMIGEDMGLTDLKNRLHQMELFLSDRPTKKARDIPQGFTHKEMAEKIGSSERTMQRVAKERERWPEGYHWSEESKKWFQLEG